jgi:hypothetical protein
MSLKTETEIMTGRIKKVHVPRGTMMASSVCRLRRRSISDDKKLTWQKMTMTTELGL